MFIFLCIYLAMHSNFRNWRQLFCNSSGVRTKFTLYRFSLLWFIVTMEILIISKKTYSTKLQSFLKNWCNFHIDQVNKGRLVIRLLKMLGMVQKKTVLNYLNTIGGWKKHLGSLRIITLNERVEEEATTRPDFLHFFGQGNFIFLSGSFENECLWQP